MKIGKTDGAARIRNLVLIALVFALGAYLVKRQVEMALPLPVRSIVAILGGADALGTLADGRAESTIPLKEGISVPTRLGSQPLAAKPLPALPMPDHPHLLDELASGGVHGDSYNSSTTPFAGPRGIAPIATYRAVVAGNDLSMCTPMLLTPARNMVSACVGLGRPSELVLFDAQGDFDIIAQTGTAEPDDMKFMQPGGGWYTQLDHEGRALVMVPGRLFRAYAIDESAARPEWRVEREIDLKPHLEKSEHLIDVRPDWQGNLWYFTGYGHIGYIDRDTDQVRSAKVADGEKGAAALAIIPGGVFYFTTHALYRLEIGESKEIFIRWRYAYGPSNSENGDLTAPTVFDGGRLIAVGVNDGSPQGRVLVLKTDPAEMPASERQVCEHPVFKLGKSFLDNTFVGYGRSLVVQNNAGGVFFDLVEYEPGLARIDVREDHSGCDTVWEDYTVSSQVPPKLSTGDGHVYQYSRRMGTGEDIHAWYLSATDFETGETVSELFVGSGERLDNPMLSIDFMPGNVMVGGVRNGIVILRDSPR